MRTLQLSSFSAAIVGLALTACTDSGASLVIVNNLAPGAGCVPENSLSGTFISRGVIDANSDLGYIMTPVVQSVAESPAATSNATRIIQIEGYNVDITFEDDGPSSFDESLLSFSRSLGVSVLPSSTAGFGVEIVPRQLLEQLSVSPGDSRNLSVEIQLFGSIDGGDIESNTFVYPVEVCNGCLIADLGPCTELPSGFEGNSGGECNALQDLPLDCCTASGGATICPAVHEETL